MRCVPGRRGVRVIAYCLLADTQWSPAERGCLVAPACPFVPEAGPDRSYLPVDFPTESALVGGVAAQVGGHVVPSWCGTANPPSVVSPLPMALSPKIVSLRAAWMRVRDPRSVAGHRPPSVLARQARGR